jgi:tRNA G10  N-methylase Trm11
MKYLFILGRNIELSIAELSSYFSKLRIDFEQLGLINNGLLLEIPGVLKRGTIDKLGGVVSIGEVFAQGDYEEIVKELENKELYEAKGNKLNYVIHNFNAGNFEGIQNYLKDRFKEERLKATEKKLTGSIKLQKGGTVPKVTSNLIDEQYFIFGEYFGKIVEESNYEEIEERDMKKPVRRNELAISPRLAKILINLSEVKEKEILLDPFCGIGVVLEEALLQGINVIGVDIDRDAVEGARKNLEYFKFNKNNYKLIKSDSSKVEIGKSSGIATEPDLGKLQKSNPSEKEARATLDEFEKLIVKVINNVKKNVKGKIAFTAPLVLVGKSRKRIECDFEKIAKLTGLNILEGPIAEFREKSIVGRSIIVLGK